MSHKKTPTCPRCALPAKAGAQHADCLAHRQTLLDRARAAKVALYRSGNCALCHQMVKVRQKYTRDWCGVLHLACVEAIPAPPPLPDVVELRRYAECPQCVHCGDPAIINYHGMPGHHKALLHMGQKVFRDTLDRPCCYGCWRELVAGETPNVTRGRVGRGARGEESSPSQDNAIRSMEGA